MLSAMLDPQSYWRSPWRSHVAAAARGVERARITPRIEAVLHRHGAPIDYEIFGHAFLHSAAADREFALVLSDAQGDLFAVAERERAATKALAVHEMLSTALGDLLLRATSGRGDIGALSAWIMGDAEGPPPD